MLAKVPRIKASSRIAVHLCLVMIGHRVICIFLATALLLVPQIKAQENASSVSDLIQQLRSHDAGVRSSAADALEKIGPGAKEAVPGLIVALKDQDGGVRSSAADALGSIGRDAKEAVPALSAALKDPDKDVRKSAAAALGNMASDFSIAEAQICSPNSRPLMKRWRSLLTQV